MKKIIEITVAIKSVGAMFFSGVIITYTVLAGLLGQEGMPFSLIWQALFIALLAAGLHYAVLCSPRAKRGNGTKRVLFYALLMLFIIAAFAFFFRWFLVESVAA